MREKKITKNKIKRIVVIALIGIIFLVLFTLLISRTYFMRLLSNVSDSLGYRSDEIKYDNSNSQIEASNMQGAIDELYNKCLKLKEQCPDGNTCIKNSDMDAKKDLKESISSLEKKLDELKDKLSDEDKGKTIDVLNEAKDRVYNDNFDKMNESKDKLKSESSRLDEITKE